MALLEDEAASGPMAPRITVLRNTEAAAITRSVDGQLSVALRSTADGGSESVYAPALVVGCDGMHSVVRGTLQAWAANEDAHPASTPAAGSNTHHAPALAPAAGAAAAAASSRFGMVHAPSLSTNLRFKVLQLPPNPAMADGTVLHNPSFSLLVGQKAPLIGACRAARACCCLASMACSRVLRLCARRLPRLFGSEPASKAHPQQRDCTPLAAAPPHHIVTTRDDHNRRPAAAPGPAAHQGPRCRPHRQPHHAARPPRVGRERRRDAVQRV
jgi:2-polyprenyl-6-methoxyphenol hydroxylase-like FAD-dependent oxidoreductase